MRAFIVRPFGTKGGVDIERVEAEVIAPGVDHLGVAARTTAEIGRIGKEIMDPEHVWQRMSDEEIRSAAQQLDEYTEAGQQAILAELERRELATSGPLSSGKPAADTATLSAEVQRRVDLMFPSENREEATRLLEDLQKGFSEIEEGAFGLERVQSAALKVSHGNLDRLRMAIEVGRRDFRDLLSAAGFGSLTAHERWEPKRTETSWWESLLERFFGMR